MLRITASLLAVLALAACSQQETPPLAPNEAAQALSINAVKARLARIRPDLQLSDVKPSEIPGFYTATINGGPSVYISVDGRYLLSGSAFEISDSGLIDLQDKALLPVRKAAVAQLNVADQIVFKPAGATKAVVHVFTDVDCGYCQKLHAEMADYHAAGIEVRYLAYPRAGIGSESYRKIASAWCAEDKNDAMTRLKQRQSIPENVCKGNPVAKQFALGQKLGVSGTPALLLEDGTLLPGYLNADRLAAELGI